jgi:hypothetical protein
VVTCSSVVCLSCRAGKVVGLGCCLTMSLPLLGVAACSRGCVVGVGRCVCCRCLGGR